MGITYVIVKDGLVIECVTVNSIDDLTAIYTEHLIIERAGNENIGWTYDGVTFNAPLGV